MITEHSAHADSHRNSSTSDNGCETVSRSVSQHRNSSTTDMSTTTTVTDQQRPASAAVNWSAWQAPVDSHEQRDTVANYDDTAYDYNNEDVEDDEHLKTKTERQQLENNASGTEGRPVYVVR